jgi:Dyp-type peroxidase family
MATVAVFPLADPQQIQGNILRPFAGRYQAFLFLTFRSNRPGARAWLGALAGRVSGTGDVEAVRKSADRDPAAALVNVGLTATGLVLLHPEAAGALAGFDAFWRGPLGSRLDDAGRLTTAPALLGDVGRNDPASWVIGGPGGPPVDALLTIAADDAGVLNDAVEFELRAAGNARLAVLSLAGAQHDDPRVQRAEVLTDEQGRRVEHFGYADGISQPGVRGYHDPAQARPGSPVIAAGEFILGCAGERRPQTWAPRPAPAPWMWGGSFQVFRRLRQDASGWWERMSELGGTPDAAAARALGRRLDGTPLASRTNPADQNDFTYRDDELGARTPLYAHIRKVNPREDKVFRDRSHKMLRRGIPFGPRFERRSPDDRERGMIFNAYLASIEDQFEFVQRRWANDPGFPASTLAKYGRVSGDKARIDGLDPVLGDGPDAAGRRLAADVVREIPRPAFGGFVTTTGAVYAFAPALPALRLLAGEDRLDTPEFLAG